MTVNTQSLNELVKKAKKNHKASRCYWSVNWCLCQQFDGQQHVCLH